MSGPASPLARRLVGTLIVLFWAVMLALLVRREAPSRLAAPTRAAGAQPARELWYGLLADGDRRVGTVHISEADEERGGGTGRAVHVRASLAVLVAGTPARLRLSGSAWRADTDGHVELQAAVTSGVHEFSLQGAVRDGVLEARVTSGGSEIPVRTPLSEGLFAPGASPLGHAVPALAPGEETLLPAFDPLTLRPTQVKVRRYEDGAAPAGGPEEFTQVLHVASGATTLVVWTDASSEIVQATTPFGLVLRRLSREAALAPAQAFDAGELLAGTLVPPTGEVPFRGARRMVVRLSGAAATLPEDESQRSVGATRWAIAPLGPVLSATLSAGEAPDLADALASDALVQADHPRIVRQATTIVAGESDPWRRALRIHHWVHKHIRKRAVLSLPSALDVLASREGDCNEHTVLFTALARAAGIPTRIAVGLAWSEDLEAFGYHAWPEVWVGRWVWMDPTFGEEVADATHIKLVEGGIERWAGVLAFVGQLQVEVVEVE